ncbi:unnamed protein product [Malus baccata var. baccata]
MDMMDIYLLEVIICFHYNAIASTLGKWIWISRRSTTSMTYAPKIHSTTYFQCARSLWYLRFDCTR